jgi:hypothetical protein
VVCGSVRRHCVCPRSLDKRLLTRCFVESDQAPAADTGTYAEQAVWASDGEMVRVAYTLHPEDDDFEQARILLTEVMDDAQE